MRIASDAGAKPLQVPEGARGLSVTIEVTSAMKTIDGATPASPSPAAVALGAIVDPLDTAIGAATNVPPVRVVKARLVAVEPF